MEKSNENQDVTKYGVIQWNREDWFDSKLYQKNVAKRESCLEMLKHGAVRIKDHSVNLSCHIVLKCPESSGTHFRQTGGLSLERILS